MKKNRRFAIVAFLLVAILAVGVGYAQFSEVLRINGTFGAAGADVYFENATIKVNGEDLSAEQKATNYATIAGDKNTLTVVMGDALINTGDTAVITVDVTNDAAFDVKLDAAITNNLTNFSFDCSLQDTQTLKAGETLAVTITVKLTIVPDIATSQTFAIALTATEINA